MRKKMLLVCTVAILCCASLISCSKGTDPETGKTTYRLDTKAADNIEKGVKTGLDIMAILSALFPVLLPVVGAGTGIYGAWRVVRPKLEIARDEANTYHIATSSLVTAVEKFKITNPEQWKDLKEVLSDKLGPNAENVIRALRGLPPKD